MQVKAIYEDGAVNFIQPLRFKHRKFEVVVNIPEEEMEHPASQLIDNTIDARQEPQSSLDILLAKTPSDPWLQRMKAIELHVLSLPDDQLPELTAKQLDRIEAFVFRQDR